MPRISVLRRLLVETGYVTPEESDAYDYSTKIGQELIRKFLPELRETLVLNNGEISDDRYSRIITRRIENVLGIVDVATIAEEMSGYSDAGEYSARLKAYCYAKLISSFSSDDVYSTSGANHYKYLMAWLSKIDSNFNKKRAHKYLQGLGLKTSSIRNFQARGDPKQLITFNSALGVSPAILYWLYNESNLLLDLFFKSAFVYDVDAGWWTNVGVLQVPSGFEKSMFDTIDGYLLRAHKDKLIPFEKKYHHQLYTYSKMRETTQIKDVKYNVKGDFLEFAANLIHEKYRSDKPETDIDRLLLSMKIFFGKGYDPRFMFLHDVDNGYVVLPKHHGLGPLIWADGQPIVTISHDEYFKLMVTDNDIKKKKSDNPFLAYLDDYINEYYPKSKSRHQFLNSKGITPGVLGRVLSTDKRDYMAIDGIADILDINKSKLYWERFGAELSKYIKFQQVEIKERAKVKSNRRVKIGAVAMSGSITSVILQMKYMLNELLENKIVKNVEGSYLYDSLKTWKKNPKTYSPSKFETYLKLASIIMRHFRLSATISNEELIAALMITFNHRRIRDYLPVYYKKQNELSKPNHIKDVWLKKKKLRIYSDESWKTNDKASSNFDYWYSRKALIKRNFETVNGKVVLENSAEFEEIGVVVIPIEYGDVLRDVHRGLVILQKNIDINSLHENFREVIVAMLTDKKIVATEKQLYRIAELLSAKSKLRQDRITPMQWFAGLVLYSNYDDITSNLPLYDEHRRTYYVPPNLKGRFMPLGKAKGSDVSVKTYQTDRVLVNKIATVLNGSVKLNEGEILTSFEPSRILREANWLMDRSFNLVDRDTFIRLLDEMTHHEKHYGIKKQELVITLFHLLWLILKDNDKRGLEMVRICIDHMGYSWIGDKELSTLFGNGVNISYAEINAGIEALREENALNEKKRQSEAADSVPFLVSIKDAFDVTQENAESGDESADKLLGKNSSLVLKNVDDFKKLIPNTHYRFAFSKQNGLEIIVMQSDRFIKNASKYEFTGFIRFSDINKLIYYDVNMTKNNEGLSTDLIEKKFKSLGFRAIFKERLIYDKLIDDPDDNEGGSSPPVSSSGSSQSNPSSVNQAGGRVAGFDYDEDEYADFLRKKEEKRKKRKAQIPVSDQKIDYNGMPVGSEAKIPSTLMMPLDVLIK